jgi:hypothetical protein
MSLIPFLLENNVTLCYKKKNCPQTRITLGHIAINIVMSMSVRVMKLTGTS